MEYLIILHRSTAQRGIAVAFVVFPFAEQTGYSHPDITTFKPGPVQEPIVLCRGSLARKPETIHVGAKILVLLQRHADRPVAVGAIGPSLEVSVPENSVFLDEPLTLLCSTVGT